MRYVPDYVNLILLGELMSHGCWYVGIEKWCKVYCGASLVMQGNKAENNICCVKGCCIRKCKIMKKKFQFSEEVEVFGDFGRERNLLGFLAKSQTKVKKWKKMKDDENN